jgi:hypothetical protein
MDFGESFGGYSWLKGRETEIPGSQAPVFNAYLYYPYSVKKKK